MLSQATIVMLLGTTAVAAACSQAPETPSAASAPSTATPAEHAQGEALFNQHCAQCHGPAASGTARGPSFIHKIYEPGHHGDPSFILAVRNGVRAHHWGFGDMPPYPVVTEPDIQAITAYVRWLQRQAGIH